MKYVYLSVGLMLIALSVGVILLTSCSSVGERAARVCTDAKLSPGTQSYENCVIRYLPTEQ